MITKFTNIIALILMISLTSCLTGGTHGSIKSYEYLTDKYNLQKAIEKVISNSYNIKRDTTNNYIIDKTDNRNDTINNNYYNDGERYLTIYINDENGLSNYTIQYSGDKTFWDTSKTSYLSIAYAFDKDSNGGSEGNSDISGELKRRLLKTFEKELIFKVDIELGQQHRDVN